MMMILSEIEAKTADAFILYPKSEDSPFAGICFISMGNTEHMIPCGDGEECFCCHFDPDSTSEYVPKEAIEMWERMIYDCPSFKHAHFKAEWMEKPHSVRILIYLF